MSKEDPDFDVDNYNIEELLTIFGIKSPVEKEAIMKITADLIAKYRELGHSQYAEFFSKGMNRLLSNYTMVEGILGKVDKLLDDIKDVKKEITTKVQDTTEELAEQVEETITEKIEETKDLAQEFLNPPVQAAAPNVLENRYYDAQRMQTRLGPGVVMPNRADYTNVPTEGVGTHAPQLQNRLFMPNAYTQIPFAQGYRNPTLQNAFLTWVNIDSQYREILPTGSASASCPSDPSGNFYQADNSTDFTFALASPITNVLAMTVGSIEVPMAGYYAFSDKYGNTTFEVVLGETVISCLRIPEGNYDADEIMRVINDILTNVWKSKDLSFLPHAPQMIIDKSNQKVYFAFPSIPDEDAQAVLKEKPLKFRWFDREKCGCCNECCSVSDAIDEANPPHSTIPYRRPVKDYQCSDKNTGKKINSTLGWSLGFREKETTFDFVNTKLNLVADLFFSTRDSYYGMFGTCIWNQLGTKYLILEVDDFNRNRNSGNLGTMSMPACTENFKLPSYANKLSQVYPICDPSDNIQRFPDPGTTETTDPQHIVFSSSALDEVFDIGPIGTAPLPIFTYKSKDKQSYYEKFNRACRKGTPADSIAIKGEDTLTKAQKYTAREIRGTQENNCVNQYYAPQSSNVLFRFPVQRLSTVIQAPIITTGPGMDSGRRYFGPVTIEKLRIRLLDDKGYIISLNCGEISFSLVLERLYQY